MPIKPDIPIDTINNILDYLPYHIQLQLNKKRNKKITYIYCNAKHKIVQFIRYNNTRLHYLMLLNDLNIYAWDITNASTERVLKAYFILFYPQAKRWSYCINVLRKRSETDLAESVQFFALCSTNMRRVNTKKYFRAVVNSMSTEELIYHWW